MLPSEDIKKIEVGFRTLNIIWGAMLISVFIYIIVGLYIVDEIDIHLESNIIDMLRNVLYGSTLSILFVTKLLRGMLLSAKGSSANTVRSQIYSQYPAISKYTTALIITLALCESIGILGLTLFILGKNLKDLYLFIIVSAASMIYYRPKKEDIVNLAKEMIGKQSVT